MASSAEAVSAAQKASSAAPKASKAKQLAKTAGGAAVDAAASYKGAAKGAAKGGGDAARYALRGGRTSPQTAKRIILFSLVVSGGAVVLYDMKKGQTPSVRLGVGVLFGGILLSALADVAPEVAAPLGLLMVVGVLLTPKSGGSSPGQELIRSVSTVVGKKG